jgi:5-methylcytosine-specific restriction endonuclease McrA
VFGASLDVAERDRITRTHASTHSCGRHEGHSDVLRIVRRSLPARGTDAWADAVLGRTQPRRLLIFERDRYTCRYCARVVRLVTYNEFTRVGKWPADAASIDHVVPLSRGGSKSDEKNLVTACVPCNNKKGSKTLREAGLVLLPVPVTRT